MIYPGILSLKSIPNYISLRILVSGAAPLGGDVEKEVVARLKVPIKQVVFHHFLVDM